MSHGSAIILTGASTGSWCTRVEEGAVDVQVAALAGEGGGQVEAEAVDVHLADPVPQRVQDQAQRGRVADVEAVAGAGGVEVVGPVLLDEAVVGRVVDALHRQRRPEVVAFGRVVVDDVEDDLEPGGVQSLDHRLELVDLAATRPGRAVLAVRGQEADAVVPPVIAQAPLEQVGVLDELVDRQQLDGGDPEVGQVTGYRRVRQPGVGAAKLVGHVRVALRQALHVGLVDHGLVQRGRAPGLRPSRSRWP